MLQRLICNARTLTNTKNDRSIRSSKEGYFDKKWGADTAFNKNADRALYETLTDADFHWRNEVNDRILVTYKTKFSKDSGNFISKITEETQAFLACQQSIALQSDKKSFPTAACVHMVEEVFDVLKAYAYEFNNVVGYGPLHLSATDPQLVTEVLKFNKLRQAEEQVTHYRARISTSTLSLVLRGNKNEIQFFLMPVSRALGLSKQESLYKPLERLIAVSENNEINWETSGEKPFTAYQMEMICMELFQKLIDETKVQLIGEQRSLADREADD